MSDKKILNNGFTTSESDYYFIKGYKACALQIYEKFCENRKDIEGIAVIDLSNELLKLCGNIQS